MFLASWIGDQAIVMTDVFKYSLITARMVAHEYHYLRRVKPKLCAMRENYPDIRLDINGDFRIH